jgi:hypothetical protein
MMNIAAASELKFEEIATQLTIAMCKDTVVSLDQVEHLMVKDAEFQQALDQVDDMKDALEAIGALQYTRLLKLFDLWDTDKDGKIS